LVRDGKLGQFGPFWHVPHFDPQNADRADSTRSSKMNLLFWSICDEKNNFFLFFHNN